MSTIASLSVILTTTPSTTSSWSVEIKVLDTKSSNSCKFFSSTASIPSA